MSFGVGVYSLSFFLSMKNWLNFKNVLVLEHLLIVCENTLYLYQILKFLYIKLCVLVETNA